MMNGAVAVLTIAEKQRELQRRCRHPSGAWQPVEWQNPRQAIPQRIAFVAQTYPNRRAAYDHQTTMT